ncbi:phosphatidylserine decarboxylase-domain-containing protein [Trametes polyzona]|nr:phosphatidylserine decarboxylase-domain-containing protein [Trametes polyzona]
MPSEVVQKLKDYLAAHPDFERDFRESLDYLDYFESYLHWLPCENKEASAIYDRMCLFYYVMNKPPLSAWRTPIDPSSRPPWTWLSQWCIEYSKEIGKAMNAPGSLTPETLQSFYASPAYHMDDYIVPPGGWRTFNDFFARAIKPERRPVDAPADDVVVVSPTDSTFAGAWPVDGAGATTFSAKGVPWPIGLLLDDAHNACAHAPDFAAGGTFCHAFLNSTDYHRIHAPVAGTVLEARVIEGLCYLHVEAVPVKEGNEEQNEQKSVRRRLRRLRAPDEPGFQFLQTRALVLINNPELGPVAVLPIGMPQVASVVLSVHAGQTIRKGQEIGFFQMGGSDIVMVFPPGAQVRFTTEVGKWVPFGRQIAQARVRSQINASTHATNTI